MLTKPGTKVLITEDCRDGSPATGQVGVYEGDFPRGACVFLEDGARELYYNEFVSGKLCFIDGKWKGRSLVNMIPFWSPGDREPHPRGDGFPMTASTDPAPPYWFPTTNPRIRLPDDSIIWGDECWWGDAETAPSLEKAQADLEDHKAILRGIVQAASDMGKTE